MERERCRAAGNSAGEPPRLIIFGSYVTVVVIPDAVVLVDFVALACAAEVYRIDPVARLDALKRASNRLRSLKLVCQALIPAGRKQRLNRSDRMP